MKKGCFCFIRGERVVFNKAKLFIRCGLVYNFFLVILLYMIKNNDWPVLEFDDDKDAVVNPDVLITLGYVGCPACAGNLEVFAASGITKVMFCGGGGVLDKNIKVGELLVVEGAIRDEGFSYRYIEPSRIIYTDKIITDKILSYLTRHEIPHIRGITWTTDAMFRETRALVEKRKAEGAKIVEMEQAGCIAIAQYRHFDYGAIIYGGDDVSQDEWNARSWDKRKGIRYNLVMLCRELVSMF